MVYHEQILAVIFNAFTIYRLPTTINGELHWNKISYIYYKRGATQLFIT